MIKKMKILLSVFIVAASLLIAYGAHSQTTDTVCLPIADAKIVLEAAQKYKVAQKRMVELNDIITDLNSRIDLNKKIIEEYKDKGDNYEAMIKELRGEIEVMQQQKEILSSQITLLEKKLKKANNKSKWVAAGGIISTFAAIVATVLFIK